MPETRIDVEVPKITTDLGKEMFFVKLPNFLSVECRSVKFKTCRKFGRHSNSRQNLFAWKFRISIRSSSVCFRFFSPIPPTFNTEKKFLALVLQEY